MEQKIQKQFLKFSLGGAVAEVVYCFLIALFLMNANQILGKMNQIFGTILFLLILVVSVAVSGLLIFGFPAYLAVQLKDYKNAVISLAVSLMTLAICGFIIMISLILFH